MRRRGHVPEKADILAKARGLVRMRDLLCLDRWWRSSELAFELEVDQRTVQRWLREMPAIGCMVTEDSDGRFVRYRAEATYGRLVLR